MRKKIKTIGLLSLFFLFLCGCIDKLERDNVAWGIWFRNDSKIPVSFYINLRKISNEEYRPSTQWPEEFDNSFFVNVEVEDENLFEIKPYRHFIHTGDDSLSVFVFSPDTLVKYSIEEIKATKNYLKRFDMKIKDLDGNESLIYNGNSN